MTALAAQAPHRLGIYESTYTATPTADGWTQFDVVGAQGDTPPWFLLWLIPLAVASLGFKVGWPQATAGAALAFFLTLCFVAGRSGSLSTFRRRRAPAGRFAASAQGVRLHGGHEVPTARIRRLVCRNVQDSTLVVASGGTGMVGGLAALGAARHVADANAYVPLSYQIEIEVDGRVLPVVGSLTAATASALFDDLSRILDIH